MKKKVWLHVGTARTGTTFLQNLLVDRRDELKEQGVYFDRDKEIWGNFLMDISPLTEAQVALYKMLFEEFYAGLPFDKFFTVAEGMTGNPLNGHRNVGSIAKDVGEVFANFDTKIFMVLRSQDTYFESLYYQKIKEGTETRTFVEFMNGFILEDFKWDRIVNAYTKVFGKDNVHVLCYEGLRGKLLGEFGKRVGFHVKPFTPEMVNAALTPQGIKYMQACLAVAGIDDEDRLKIRTIFQENFCKDPYEPFSLFNQEERYKLTSIFEESNEAVFK